MSNISSLSSFGLCVSTSLCSFYPFQSFYLLQSSAIREKFKLLKLILSYSSYLSFSLFLSLFLLTYILYSIRSSNIDLELVEFKFVDKDNRRFCIKSEKSRRRDYYLVIILENKVSLITSLFSTISSFLLITSFRDGDEKSKD